MVCYIHLSYNVGLIQYNTTFNCDLINKHIIESIHYQQKLNMNFVKVEFMVELLDGIALDCTGVPNKVATDRRYPAQQF